MGQLLLSAATASLISEAAIEAASRSSLIAEICAESEWSVAAEADACAFAAASCLICDCGAAAASCFTGGCGCSALVSAACHFSSSAKDESASSSLGPRDENRDASPLKRLKSAARCGFCQWLRKRSSGRGKERPFGACRRQRRLRNTWSGCYINIIKEGSWKL